MQQRPGAQPVMRQAGRLTESTAVGGASVWYLSADSAIADSATVGPPFRRWRDEKANAKQAADTSRQRMGVVIMLQDKISTSADGARLSLDRMSTRVASPFRWGLAVRVKTAVGNVPASEQARAVGASVM